MNDHNLLLIIAHPDDECMFFLPALTYFKRQAHTIHVLCLSTGTKVYWFHISKNFDLDYKILQTYSISSNLYRQCRWTGSHTTARIILLLQRIRYRT